MHSRFSKEEIESQEKALGHKRDDALSAIFGVETKQPKVSLPTKGDLKYIGVYLKRSSAFVGYYILTRDSLVYFASSDFDNLMVFNEADLSKDLLSEFIDDKTPNNISDEDTRRILRDIESFLLPF